MINDEGQKHEKTRLNRADVLCVELGSDDYILLSSHVRGQEA